MSTDVPEAIAAPPRRSGWLPAVVALIALACTIAGGVVLQRAGPGDVTLIRVTRHSVLPESFVGSPDYYVNVVLNDKQTIMTGAYDDSPIGNGLDFELADAMPLADVASIELMDKDIGSDDIRDRVDVRERICRGQNYEFELIGPPARERNVGFGLLGAGGAALVISAILWARTNAI